MRTALKHQKRVTKDLISKGDWKLLFTIILDL